MVDTQPEPTDAWYVYIVECADGSLYTGVTKDVSERVKAHNDGRGAKYTRGRTPVRLRGSSRPLSRGEALRIELRVKQLPREDKLSALHE